MRSSLKSNIAAVLAAAGMALAAPAILAQSNTQGAIVGNVVKDSGAEIVIISRDSGLTRSITPDSEGRFAATALPTGRYTVTLKTPGTPDQNVDVVVGVGSNSVVRFDQMMVSEVVVTGERRVAAIDTSTVEANLQITADELAELPVARTETAVALLAPGTTLGDYRFPGTQGGQTAGLASFSGSSVAENAYFVNGFNVTNFRNGLGGSTIPFEAYNDFQVKTGGYSAEFGRSTGGVVNTTTKRGTNEWKFGVNVTTVFPDLEGSQSDVYYTDPTTNEKVLFQAFKRDEVEDTTANLEIGGPILKDRLFIYGLYQFRDQTATNWTISQRLVDKSTDPFWLGKVDLKITDNHLLEFTYWSDQNDVERETFDGADTAANFKGNSIGKGVLENGGDNWIAKYTGYLGDNFTVSALYGTGKYARSEVGAGDSCPLVIDARVTSQSVGCSTSSTGQVGTQDDEREAYRIDFGWRLGDHQLRFGYDNETNKSTDSIEYSGGVYYRYVSAVPGSTIQGGVVPAGVTELVRIREYNNGGSFEVESQALYLEDNWNVTDNFLLSLGVRNEVFENFNSLGESFVKMDNQWAPRLGFSWDMKGDASSKLYGNAGRYYLPVASNTNIRLAGGELFTQQYFQFSGIDTAGDWSPVSVGAAVGNLQFFSDGTIKDPTTIVNQDLDAHYQDEFILGYQFQLNDLWSFGIKGVYRDLKSSLEDMALDVGIQAYADAQGIGCGTAVDFCVGGFDYYVLTNPGKDVKMSVDFGDGNGLTPIVLDAKTLGYPKAQRTYKAVELTADRAFDDNWYMKASYVYAKAKGNIEGYVNSDVGQDDAGITISFDQPGLTDGAYGRLPNDREHTLKFFGLYQLTPEWRFSSNMYAQSGRPRNCLGVHPTDDFAAAYGNDSFYCNVSGTSTLVPRGTAGETPWIYNIDLGVEYRPAFFDDNMSVKLDVFNVFNFQDAVYQDEYGEETSGAPRYSYASTVRYQRARAVRLGVTYNFGLK